MSGKRLYLIRHAKSSWSEGGLSDHERPLNERGQVDAPAMAERLSKTDRPPSHFVISTAQRTRETFEAILQTQAEGFTDFEFDDNLYLAAASDIIERINALPPEIESVALIGHNPGMSYAATRISGEQVNMVTAHVVGIDLHVEDWAAVSAETGSIVYFDFPKKHTRT